MNNQAPVAAILLFLQAPDRRNLDTPTFLPWAASTDSKAKPVHSLPLTNPKTPEPQHCTGNGTNRQLRAKDKSFTQTFLCSFLG